MKKIAEFLIFATMMMTVAIGIERPAWFGYGWDTFVPYHIVTGTIGFVLMTIYLGRNEHGKYEMFSDYYSKRFAAFFILASWVLGPLTLLAMIATMLEHRIRYGRFTWGR